MLWLELHTSDTELVELLYISTETEPEIFMANQFQYFVLTIMSSKNVIIIILEDVCTKITSRWYINSIAKEEKTIQIYKPLAICRDVFCSNWVTSDVPTYYLSR